MFVIVGLQEHIGCQHADNSAQAAREPDLAWRLLRLLASSHVNTCTLASSRVTLNWHKQPAATQANARSRRILAGPHPSTWYNPLRRIARYITHIVLSPAKSGPICAMSVADPYRLVGYNWSGERTVYRCASGLWQACYEPLCEKYRESA